LRSSRCLKAKILGFAAFVISSLPLLGLGGAAQAADDTQAYPQHQVSIVVPFPPGGGTDTLARILSTKLSQEWGQQVVVENRPGAAGHIGAAMVARSAPDGYTLVMASTAAIDEENVRKFAPISIVSASSYVVTVRTALGIDSIQELIKRAKAKDNSLTFGSSGNGAASHLSVELFNKMAGVKTLHVPYKGTGQAVTDLLGGSINFMFAPAQTIIPHLNSGKLRALAVTSAQRSKILPDLPTIDESGVPGYEAVGWFGLLAPAGTPPAIVKKINASVTKALTDPQVIKTILVAGAEPSTGTPEQFASFINSELEKWTKMMKELGLTRLR